MYEPARTAPLTCPVCGKDNDSHGNLMGGKVEQPADDDYCICMYCLSFMKFADNVTRLVLLTPDEIVDMPGDARAAMVRAREFLRERKP